MIRNHLPPMVFDSLHRVKFWRQNCPGTWFKRREDGSGLAERHQARYVLAYAEPAHPERATVFFL